MPKMHETWAAPYRAAILELDGSKLRARIDEARKAIQARWAELDHNPDHDQERQAMLDALQNLRVLSRLER